MIIIVTDNVSSHIDEARRRFLISRLVHRHVVLRRGFRGLNSAREIGVTILHVGHRLSEVTANWIDQTISHFVVYIDKEVRGGRVCRVVVLEYLIQVLDLGHVLVVILAPDVTVEIVDIDPVMSERNRPTVHKHCV